MVDPVCVGEEGSLTDMKTNEYKFVIQTSVIINFRENKKHKEQL